MTYEEIKEKYAHDKSGYVSCWDCPLCILDKNGVPEMCAGYEDACDGYEEAYSRIQQYLNYRRYVNNNCHQYLNNKENTIVLYIDWEKKKILNESEYNKMLRKLEYTTDEEFSNWLNLYYSSAYIFKMNEDDKKEITNKFLAESEKDIKNYEKIVVNL